MPLRQEQWDSDCTPPAPPSGWNFDPNLTTAAGPSPVSSPNLVELSAGAGGFFCGTWGTPDANGGNVSVVGYGRLGTGVSANGSDFSVFARSNDAVTTYASSTFIEANWSGQGGGNELEINTNIAGTRTTITSLGIVSAIANVWAAVGLYCNGSTISVTVQRFSDGFWMDSSGTFVSGPQTALSTTITSISGAGYAGFAASSTGAVPVYADDWTFDNYSAGTTSVQGFEGHDALSASSTVGASGSLTATEAHDALAGSAATLDPAALSHTTAGDTLSASGRFTDQTTISASEARDSLSGAGSFNAPAALARTERGDSFAGTSISTWAALAPTEAHDVLAATGSTMTSGTSLAGLEHHDALAAWLTISPFMLATEGHDSFSGSATAATASTALAATEAHDLFSAGGSFSFDSRSTFNLLEREDIFAGVVVQTSAGAAALSEHGDRFAGTTAITSSATLGPTEQGDLFRAGYQSVLYHVYTNAGSGPINYSSIVATTAALTWTSAPLAFAATWMFAVRAAWAIGGLEEQNLDCEVNVVLDAFGHDVTNLPAPPLALRAFATVAGGIRVEWVAPPVYTAKAATGFLVFYGSGGSPNYGVVRANVPASSAIGNNLVTNLAGLTGGITYTIGVRAYNTTGEEQNTNTVTVTPITAGPLPVQDLTGIGTAQAFVAPALSSPREPPMAPFTLAESALSPTTNGTSFTVAAARTVAPGDLVIIGIANGAGGPSLISSVVDSNGNHFAAIPFLSSASPVVFAYWLIVPPGSGGSSYSVTVTTSVSGFFTVGMDRFTAGAGTAFFPSAQLGNGTGTVATTTPLSFGESGAEIGLAYALAASTATPGGAVTGLNGYAIGYSLLFESGVQFGLASAFATVNSGTTPTIGIANATTWAAASVLFVLAPAPPMRWVDTFQAGNGIAMIGRFSDSGAVYSNVTGQTLVTSVVQNESPYSAVDGSFAWTQAGVTLGLDDPIQATIALSGTAAAQSVLLLNRAQPGGNAYWLNLNLFTNEINLGGAGVSGFGSFTPSAVYPADTYLLTWCTFGLIHNIYLQSVRTGLYFNPVTQAFQDNKVVLLTGIDGTIRVPGSPGLITSTLSTDAGAYVCHRLEGGPQIMLPTDLMCKRVSDVFVELRCLSSEGGVAPVSYALEQQVNGSGPWAFVTYLTPGVVFYAPTAASTAYSFRVRTTDASIPTPNVQVSNEITVTTLSARAATPYTLRAGSLTQIVNGTLANDTAGNPMFLDMFVWDEKYHQYFGFGGSLTTPGATNGYVSSDLLNWTNYGQLWDTTIGGVTYAVTGGITMVPYSDGYYYILTSVQAFGGPPPYVEVIVLRSANPLGPYTYWSGPLNTNSNQMGDTKSFQDHDGTVWVYFAQQAGNYPCSSNCQLNAALTAFVGPDGACVDGTVGYEGPSCFRVDRALYLHTSHETGFTWNANTIFMRGGHLSQSFFNETNAVVYPTPAQALAAPAGAALGYLGTTTGIDPTLSYSTQCDNTSVTATGQIIAGCVRWAQNMSGQPASIVWLPYVIGALGIATIPFVGTLVPQAE